MARFCKSTQVMIRVSKKEDEVKKATDRFMRQAEILRRIPLAQGAWEAGVRSGDFPQPLIFGKTRFWLRDEFDAWLARIESREDLGNAAAAW